MNRPAVLRILFLSLSLIFFGISSESAFAGVHGGGGGGFHGGGGGFHGGGGGFHGGGGGFHGGGGYGSWHGGGYGGYHGGGYGGWHGGYGGWHGGYGGGYGWRGGYYGGWGGGWGWGWPWGFGLSFNFGWPYWGYYGYPYAYSYPYYYPYYPPSYYSPGYNGPGYNAPTGDPTAYSDPAPAAQTGGSFQNSGPHRPQTTPANTVTLNEAVSRHPSASYGTVLAVTGGASYRPASAERQLPPMRPEVQNVIRALRGMPPEARQQQIDSGRYSNLSPQELKLVRDAADVPSGNF
jgi:hypothetical protein